MFPKKVPGINCYKWFLTGQFQWLLVSYTSSMRIRNKKLSRRFVARIPFAKWRQILALYTRSLDYWAIYKADKNSSWRQQGLKLHQQSNSFFKKTYIRMFQGHTISQYIYDLRNKVVLESQYLVSKVWIYAKATKDSVFDLKRFLSKCC